MAIPKIKNKTKERADSYLAGGMDVYS